MTEFIAFCAGLLCSLSTASAADAQTLIRDVSVVDIEAGTVTPGQSILIENGVIAQLGPDVPAPSNVEVLEAKGAFAITKGTSLYTGAEIEK